MFFSNIFAFLFSVFGKYKLDNFIFSLEEGFEHRTVWYLTTELYNSFLEDLVGPEKDPMSWDVMRWSSLVIDPTARLTFSLDSSDMMDGRWICGLRKVARCRQKGVLPATAAYYIREVEKECKRKSWPSAEEEEEEEEAWSPHDYGSTDEGEDMVESSWQLIVYINISIRCSYLKLKLSKIKSAAEHTFSSDEVNERCEFFQETRSFIQPQLFPPHSSRRQNFPAFFRHIVIMLSPAVVKLSPTVFTWSPCRCITIVVCCFVVITYSHYSRAVPSQPQAD